MGEKYMLLAFEEANKALKIGEVPVGAVIVKNGVVIAKSHNRKEKHKNAIKHAEIIAIEKACKKIKDWRLEDCSIYVTLEPCLMCMGAIVESRIKNVFCGVRNSKSNYYNEQIAKENNISINYGMMKNEINEQINTFFKTIR